MSGISPTASGLNGSAQRIQQAQAAYDAALNAERAGDANVYTAETAYNTAKSSATDASGKLDAATGKVSDAEKAQSTAKSELEKAQSAFDDVKGKVGSTQKDLDAATTKLTEATANAEKAQTELTAAQTELTTASTAVTTAQTALTEATTKVTDAKKTLKDADTAVKDAEKAVKDTEKGVTDATKALKDADKDVADATKDVASAEKSVAAANTAVTKAQGAIGPAEAALATAHTAVGTANGKIAPAQNAVNAAQGEVSAAEQALAAAQRHARANPKDAGAQSAVRAAQSRLNSARGRLNTAKGALTAAQNELKAAQQREREAQKQLDAARKALAEAEKKAKEEADKLAKAQAELEKAKTAQLKAKEDLAKAEKAHTDAVEALSKAKEAQATAKTALEAAEKAEKQAKEALDTAKEAKEKAQDAVDKAKKSLEKATEAKEKATTEVEKATKAHDDAIAKQTEAQSKVDAARKKVDEAGTGVEKAKAELDLLKAAETQAKAKVDESKKALDSAKSERTKAHDAIAGAKSTLDAARADFKKTADADLDAKQKEDLGRFFTEVSKQKDTAAGIDRAVTPEQQAKLLADQAEFDRQLAAARGAQSSAVGGASGGGFLDVVKKAAAGVQLDSREKELYREYFATHDHYVDADGSTYQAQYKDGKVQLQRNGEVATVPGGPELTRDRAIDLERDGARTATTTVKTPEAQPGTPQISQTEVIKTNPQGVRTNHDLTSESHAVADDGTKTDTRDTLRYTGPADAEKLHREEHVQEVANAAGDKRATDTINVDYDASGQPTTELQKHEEVDGANTLSDQITTDMTDGKPVKSTRQTDTHAEGVVAQGDAAGTPPMDSHATVVTEIGSDGLPDTVTTDATQKTEKWEDQPASDLTLHRDERYTGEDLVYSKETSNQTSHTEDDEGYPTDISVDHIETLDNHGAPIPDTMRSTVEETRTVTTTKTGLDISAHGAPMHTEIDTQIAHATGEGLSAKEKADALESGTPPTIPALHWDKFDTVTRYEGNDDDWSEQRYSFDGDQLTSDGVPKDGEEPDKTYDEAHVDWHEDVHDWVNNNAWKIAAGLAILALPFTGGASSALLAASFAVAAVDTANQVKRNLDNDVDANWANVGLSALGMIPGAGQAIKGASVGVRTALQTGAETGLRGVLGAAGRGFISGFGSTASTAFAEGFQVARAEGSTLAGAALQGGRSAVGFATAGAFNFTTSAIGAANVGLTGITAFNAVKDGHLTFDEALQVGALFSGAKASLAPHVGFHAGGGDGGAGPHVGAPDGGSGAHVSTIDIPDHVGGAHVDLPDHVGAGHVADSPTPVEAGGPVAEPPTPITAGHSHENIVPESSVPRGGIDTPRAVLDSTPQLYEGTDVALPGRGEGTFHVDRVRTDADGATVAEVSRQNAEIHSLADLHELNPALFEQLGGIDAVNRNPSALSGHTVRYRDASGTVTEGVINATGNEWARNAQVVRSEHSTVPLAELHAAAGRIDLGEAIVRRTAADPTLDGRQLLREAIVADPEVLVGRTVRVRRSSEAVGTRAVTSISDGWEVTAISRGADGDPVALVRRENPQNPGEMIGKRIPLNDLLELNRARLEGNHGQLPEVQIWRHNPETGLNEYMGSGRDAAAKLSPEAERAYLQAEGFLDFAYGRFDQGGVLPGRPLELVIGAKGFDDNAAFAIGRNQLLVGNAEFGAAFSPGVVGHEFGHGLFAEALGNNAYDPRGETGAVHEALADAMGAIYTQDWQLFRGFTDPSNPALAPRDATTGEGLVGSRGQWNAEAYAHQGLDQAHQGVSSHQGSGVISTALARIQKELGWGPFGDLVWEAMHDPSLKNGNAGFDGFSESLQAAAIKQFGYADPRVGMVIDHLNRNGLVNRPQPSTWARVLEQNGSVTDWYVQGYDNAGGARVARQDGRGGWEYRDVNAGQLLAQPRTPFDASTGSAGATAAARRSSGATRTDGRGFNERAVPPTDGFLSQQRVLGVRGGDKVWTSPNGKIAYTWDSLHGEIEAFSRKNGRHLGALDPVTGALIKDPVPGRTLEGL